MRAFHFLLFCDSILNYIFNCASRGTYRVHQDPLKSQKYLNHKIIITMSYYIILLLLLLYLIINTLLLLLS